MGPAMASWGDVGDWCREMHHDLEPWEKKTMVRLSQLRAIVSSEPTAKPTPTSGKK
jgi:hypothetical protein